MKYLVRGIGSAWGPDEIVAINAKEAGRKWAEVYGNAEYGANLEVTSETGEVERFYFLARYHISWETDDE